MKINLEYRKGIIFLRIIGILTRRNVSKLEDKINQLIIDEQFTNIVINLDGVRDIDMKGISTLYYIYELTKKNGGEILLCLSNNSKVREILRNQKILNYITEIYSEIQAFNIIKV